MRARTSFTILIALSVAWTVAQDAPKRQLLPAEYGRWETLGAATISPDGRWITAQIGLVEGDGRLIIRNSDGPEKAEVPLGSGARFSDDSAWVGYTIGVGREESRRLRDQRRPIRLKLGLRKLADGSETVHIDVQSWAFLAERPIAVLHHYRPTEQERGGSDLRILDLASGRATLVGNVARYVPHRDGRWVALHIESPANRHSLQLYDAESGTLHSVHEGATNYRNIVWARDTATLAFLAARKIDGKDGDAHDLAVMSNPADPESIRWLKPDERQDFPSGKRIVEFGGVRLAHDGTAVQFGIQVHAPARRDETRPEDRTNVELWHTRDVIVMPLQKAQAQNERQRHDKVVFRIAEDRLTIFANDSLDAVLLSDDLRYAYVRDYAPYRSPIRVGGLEYADVLRIDTRTGDVDKVLERVVANVGGIGAGAMSPSDDGRYCLYFRNGHWWLYEAETKRREILTANVNDVFLNTLDNRTIPEKPSAAAPRWLTDSRHFVLHSAQDAYLFHVASRAPQRLTEGRGKHQVYRLTDIGFFRDGIRFQDPLHFSVIDRDTKAQGLYRWSNGEGRMLVLDDAQLGGFTKSRHTDRMLFRMARFDTSPNIFLTNLNFEQAKPLTQTNPWQSEYHWGTTELLRYRALEQDLHATLVYPANYIAGGSYPMIVYNYELLSDGLNNYHAPSLTNAYSVQHFSQAGYFVLMPDIVYRDRNPGLSALECITAAVQAAIFHNRAIDGERIGMTGHSWGGYQTVFLATQRTRMKAFVAGAPLTELTSMYNSFYWNWGETNQVIFESSQGRMAVPWWEDWQAYWDNSPLFHADQIDAPLMVMTGTNDGAVDWHQSQYLYNTLRRMGKNMILLVYEGENHSLAREPNQKDFAERARHFFDHYLRGVPAESWVTEGIPFIRLRDGN